TWQANITAMRARLQPADTLRVIGFGSDAQDVTTQLRQNAVLPADTRTSYATTSLFDTLVLSLVKPPSTDRRAIVLVFTDGEDTSSAVDAKLLTEVAGRSPMPVFTILQRTKPVSPYDPGIGGWTPFRATSPETIKNISKFTGGDTYEPTGL